MSSSAPTPATARACPAPSSTSARRSPRACPRPCSRIRASSRPISGPRPMLLELEDVHVHYGKVEALKGISLSVDEGEIVTLIGGNGAGKSTTLKTISGLRPVTSGHIRFQGDEIVAVPAYRLVERGISQAPEGRGIFPGMTVTENLEMGAYARPGRKAELAEDFDRVFNLFPRLKERRRQLGGTLSGGEQQMLAIGRALMAR